jgi:hypothetical protein
VTANAASALILKLLTVGGGAAVVAYGLFQYLGKSWIEQKFKERLEALKHDQAIEVARLRIQIETMLSGALKLQQFEFEVLPEAWRLLEDAYSLSRWVASAYQQYDNVADLETEPFEEILNRTLPNLSRSLRSELIGRRQRDRQKQYEKQVKWHKCNRAMKAVTQLDEYISAKGLFLPKSLKEKFREIVIEIRKALLTVRSSIEYDDYSLVQNANDSLSSAEQSYKQIEEAIEERLRSHSGADAAGQK